MGKILGSPPKSPHVWPGLYQAALLEPDSTKLPDCIAEAEEVMGQRARELSQKLRDNSEEEQALDDARYVLNALRSARRTSSDADYEETA
jgi:hypothetical protein